MKSNFASLNESLRVQASKLESEAALLSAESKFLLVKAECLEWQADIKRREAETMYETIKTNEAAS